MSVVPQLDQAVSALLGLMKTYLPGPGQNLPAPTIGLATARARPVGLGDSRGTDVVGTLGVSDLKGIRVDGLVRFELWSADPGQAALATSTLDAKLIADADALPAANAWRQTSDYRVLYEFHYLDADDAESLIVQIPINVDPEEAESPS